MEIIPEVVDLHLVVNHICPRDGSFEIRIIPGITLAIAISERILSRIALD